jgi:NDP-sugar pyrophosphorylase family protein
VRAFVLAAGEGQRLRPLTEHVPKPMIEIAGRPILEHNVRMLVRHGVRDITINTHYMPDAVTAHFGDGSGLGARITYAHEPELLGTAGALNAVRGRFDETFLVAYGDNLTTCNVSALVERHRASGAAGTIALFERDDVSQSGVAQLDRNDRVVGFVEKPRAADAVGHWVNAGLLVLEPSIFGYIPGRGVSDFGKDVLPAALAAGEVLSGYRMTEHLWWIDSLADYERTARDPSLRFLDGERNAGTAR